jgi:hypothetical protein
MAFGGSDFAVDNSGVFDDDDLEGLAFRRLFLDTQGPIFSKDEEMCSHAQLYKQKNENLFLFSFVSLTHKRSTN